MATYQYGSRNNYSFDGYTSVAKIGKSFVFPTQDSKYYAPDLTGSLAQPCLVTKVEIQLGNYNSGTISTKFAVWESNGANGVYSSSISLSQPADVTNPPYASGTLSKIVYGTSTYIVGFTKGSGTYTWNADSSKSGYIWQDNKSNSGNFTNSANYEAGTLVYRLTYANLPIAPVLNSATQSGTTNSVVLSWTAPTDNGGSAVTGYRIRRSTDNATWTTVVANTGSTSTTYTDTALIYGTKYYYQVAAHNLVSTTAGTNYSGAYSASSNVTLSQPGGATDKTSTLSVSVSNTSIALPLFDDTGAGIPFNRLEVVYGGENFYNRVTATSDSTSTDPQTVDATSYQSTFGLRVYSVDGLLNADNPTLSAVANEYLWRYYKPSLRVQSIGVILEKLTDDQLKVILGSTDDNIQQLELGDGIQVSFTPNGVGSPITRLCWIIGISWDVTLESTQVLYKLQSAENEIFTLDSNTFGFLDTNILG